MASLRQVLRSFQPIVCSQATHPVLISAQPGLLFTGRRATVPLCQGVSFHTSRLRRNEHVINIQDEEDFEKRVVGSKVPVVVDFHATWCGPCKMLAPRLEKVVAAQNGQVIMAKVDIDELSDIAMNHDVSAVPTVVGIKNGKVSDKFIGMKDDRELESFVKKLSGL